MTRKKLHKLRTELARLYRSPQRAIEMERLAKKLGRELENRGKHPMWVSTEFSHLFPLSIPRHAGKDLSIGVQRSILNSLEDDLLAWEERFANEEKGDDEREASDEAEDDA